MPKMSVSNFTVHAHSHTCHDFLDDEGRERDVTVVITLTSVKELEEKTLFFYGCNYGKNCRNPNCRYGFREVERR